MVAVGCSAPTSLAFRVEGERYHTARWPHEAVELAEADGVLVKHERRPGGSRDCDRSEAPEDRSLNSSEQRPRERIDDARLAKRLVPKSYPIGGKGFL